MSLLEVALKSTRRNRVITTDEDLELAIAWMQDKVTMGQATKAKYGKGSDNGTGGRILYLFAVAFKKAYQEGKIEFK